MQPTFTAPTFEGERFNCPHCLAFAQIKWSRLQAHNFTDFYMATCCSCSQSSLWIGEGSEKMDFAVDLYGGHPSGRMIYPGSPAVAHAHPHMPANIAAEFEEARQVFAVSPRSAAALLRLCIQKLCEHLLGKPGDINQQIGELVKQGLSERVQMALDTVRVVGNHAVHPGTLNVEDRPELVQAMFGLVNLIVEKQISEPAAIDTLFQGLPPNTLAAIEKRDKP